MAGEISLGEKRAEEAAHEEGLFRNLEERVDCLLVEFQELMRERDDLATALGSETEKVKQLERKLEALTQDREKIKARIDQLLHRLQGTDA
jgi:hypothetical protein